jgi:hypothetical protein
MCGVFRFNSAQVQQWKLNEDFSFWSLIYTRIVFGSFSQKLLNWMLIFSCINFWTLRKKFFSIPLNRLSLKQQQKLLSTSPLNDSMYVWKSGFVERLSRAYWKCCSNGDLSHEIIYLLTFHWKFIFQLALVFDVICVFRLNAMSIIYHLTTNWVYVCIFRSRLYPHARSCCSRDRYRVCVWERKI